MAKLLRVKLKRSMSKCTPNQVANIRGLGLLRLHQERVILDTQPNRGMVRKVQQWLDVEALEGPESLRESSRLRRKKASV